MAEKVALVTGGTSGIGLETARALARAKVRVTILSRTPGEYEFPHIACDVTDPVAARAAVQAVVAREGRLDILVNAAGFGISGAFEFTDPDEARRQLETNLMGMSHMMQAALPVMRRQKAGRIVNVSSVAAEAAIPFQAWYSVTKAAVNALTLAVANEVRPFGITVCAAMPGDIQTGFTDARRKSTVGDDVYGGRIQRSVAKMERDERNGMPASFAGGRIARLALKRHPKPLSALGFVYKACCVLLKLLPVRISQPLIGLLYGG